MNNRTHIILAGGRLTKWKGKVVSCAPVLGSSVSSLALAAAITVGGPVLTVSRAEAACVSSVPDVYNCSGSMPGIAYSGADLSITLDDTVTVPNGSSIGLNLRGDNSLTLKQAARGGPISGTSLGLQGIVGPSGAGTLSITTTGAVHGNTTGIFAYNYGHGATSVTSADTVTGGTNTGIYAKNQSAATDLTITANNTSGGYYGINANNQGQGATIITSNGAVSQGKYGGIRAVNGANATGLAITAADVTITGTETSAAIFALNNGSGITRITTGGAVTNSGFNGILSSDDTRSGAMLIGAHTVE
ncbi:MAG: hypothetical protein ORN49_11465, partial [Rhodobacteraceae bacterium]|nr:hypothetical protein [Paracoccaceae bacterium]